MRKLDITKEKAPGGSVVKNLPANEEGFPGGSVVKNLPAIQKMQEMPHIQFLGWEDPLQEGTPTHCSILALENPMDRGAWQATVHRVTQSRT